MPAARRWIVSEQTGHGPRFEIESPALVVELVLERAAGPREPLGTYELDLVALTAQGAVNRREVPEGWVYDVRVTCDEDGQLFVGDWSDGRAPIHAMRVA